MPKNFIEVKGSPFIIFIAGLIVLLVGSAYLDNYYKQKSYFIEVEAHIITEINESQTVGDEKAYHTYAKYEVNGEKYTQYLESYKTGGLLSGIISIFTGDDSDTKIIYVNPYNPTEIISETKGNAGYIMLIIGFLCIGGYILYFLFGKK